MRLAPILAVVMTSCATQQPQPPPLPRALLQTSAQMATSEVQVWNPGIGWSSDTGTVSYVNRIDLLSGERTVVAGPLDCTECEWRTNEPGNYAPGNEWKGPQP